MSSDDRRRFGALAALIAGLFVSLALMLHSETGWLGTVLGDTLWRGLGVGAAGVPLLGFGIALAGFDRLARLDMKRAAALIGGLTLLVPFVLGLVLAPPAWAFDPPLADMGWEARAVGILPALLSRWTAQVVGTAGGLLLGFLALSGLTLATFAWHPLQRLEKTAGWPDGQTVRRPDGPNDVAPKQSSAVRPSDRPAVSAGGTRSKVAKKTADGRAPAPEAAERVWEVDLLAPPPTREIDAGEAELNALQTRLEATLAEFKVEGDVAGRTTGPVVTQYGVRLRPGVKMNRLVALADDLALKMSARSIRVARIPGRDMVGVEVPNPKSRIVMLRELLEDEQWTGEERLLPVALGLDLEGRPVIADLAKMPHLLIAGTTGTGKSVGINAIITSLIFQYQHKEDLRFLMIDPKMVELSMYKDLPHLRHPVVTNNREAARVLKWAVAEMERRYALLEANGARNVTDFNRKVEEGRPLRNPGPRKLTLGDLAAEAPDTPPPAPAEEAYSQGKIPLIVIVVDELADLMMTVQAEVETPLARLAQKARAVGLHLILATQRPSVNVITGLIKANFPSRIAFRVAQKVDSRTILDQNGAEALLGRGDMLFLEPGKSEPMRLQGAYIGTEESERIMECYRLWRAARARRGVTETVEGNILDEIPDAEGAEAPDGAPADPSQRDPLFKEAAIACVQNMGGSTSLLQRKLGIGYGRAARIMDQLENAGILGPSQGSRPRDVRIGIDQIEEYCR
ncbi:MAG TPA: DNA translocase FtsK [Gemmatimonadales bacterium]|nr:DNA translocase FtsK [Gemmatimonadales bacterium]